MRTDVNNRIDLVHTDMMSIQKDMSALKVDMHKEINELRVLLIMNLADNKPRALFAPTQASAPARVVVDGGAPVSSTL